MDPRQISAYNESVDYCKRLIDMLERDKDRVKECMNGEPLEAYLKATEEAIRRVKAVRTSLDSLQRLQQ